MAIGIKTVGPTQLSGLSDVKLGGANLKLPADAKSILAVVGWVSSPGGPTAGEPILAKLKLLSDSFLVQPYEVLLPPVGSSLGKSGVAPQDPATLVAKYPVNCPVKGGSELQVYATGLIDHTIEPYVGASIIIADFVPTPQYHGKVGDLTSTGTSAAETRGSDIRIEGGKALKEIMGLTVGTTVSEKKGLIGKFRLSSAGIKMFGDIEVLAEPIGGVLKTDATTASAQEVAHLARWPLDVPITDPIDITPYFNLAVALTDAGKWAVGLLYI